MRPQPVRPRGSAGRAAARTFVLAFGAVALGGAIATACVDGVTPDCSDPKNQCGPSLDGSPEHVEAALPEAAAPMDSAIGADAAPDADLDAGDGG
jgi:hypothetical protein